MGKTESVFMVLPDGHRYRVTRVYEKQEQQRRDWDAAHIRTLSTRVPLETWAKYRELMREEGTTMYADIKGFVQRRLEKAGRV